MRPGEGVLTTDHNAQMLESIDQHPRVGYRSASKGAPPHIRQTRVNGIDRDLVTCGAPVNPFTDTCLALASRCARDKQHATGPESAVPAGMRLCAAGDDGGAGRELLLRSAVL